MRIALIALLLMAVLGCAQETPVRTDFVVEGMHCTGCSAAITDALQAREGVVSATADHEKGTAMAVHLPSASSPEALAETIEELGYEVTSVTSVPQS